MNKNSCYINRHQIKHVDFRDVELLEKFINPNGKIIPRKRSGCTRSNQKKVEKSIKRARYMAIMPYIKN